ILFDIEINPANLCKIDSYTFFVRNGLEYGSPSPEKEEDKYITYGTVTSTNITTIDRKALNYNVYTTFIIPLNKFYIGIKYNPYWQENKTKTEIKTITGGATPTNTVSIQERCNYTFQRVPFEIALGIKHTSSFMAGIKSGFYSIKHNQWTTSDGVSGNKAEYTKDVLLFSAGIVKVISDEFELGIDGEIDFSQKDESPLYIENGFPGEGELNYYTSEGGGAYVYKTSESEYMIRFRIIPQLNKKSGKFFRFLLGGGYYNFDKDYNFNYALSTTNARVTNTKYNKHHISLEAGVGYNFPLTSKIKLYSGLRITGIVAGNYEREFYPDKYNKNILKQYKEEYYNIYSGVFTGFEVFIYSDFLIRAGVTQGIYQRNYIKETSREIQNSVTSSLREVEEITDIFLPQTIYTLGLSFFPFKQMEVEMDAGISKDFETTNISIAEETTKVNGETKSLSEDKNWYLKIGFSATVRF
ncbi:hypothetical protein DRN98_06725, partial [Methanosarcinales archaeon]